MSLLRNAFAATLAACALAALATAGGCASIWEKQPDDPLASPSTSIGRSGVRPASAETAEDEGWSWSDLSFENLGKTAKKATGQGTNRELAKNLYREADDLFRQAMAAQPARKADIFTMAAPKFAAAADRWPDSQLAMDGLFMAGESAFFADQYPQANLYYEKLVKSFPNNRYLDQVDKRRFAMARYWLNLNHDSPEPFYYVNWFNNERPWRDARTRPAGVRQDSHRRPDRKAGRRRHARRRQRAFSGRHVLQSRRILHRSPQGLSHQRAPVPRPFPGHQGQAQQLPRPGLRRHRARRDREADQADAAPVSCRCREGTRVLDRAAAEVRFRKAQQLQHLAEFYDRRAEYRAADHYYSRIVREFHDTPIAQRAEERVGQIAGLPPKPEQQLPWLVALFPESDKVKPLLRATQQAQAQAETQIAAQPDQTIQR